MKNLITRTIFGILFVVVMVGGMVWRPDTFILLFAVITGMTVWEFTSLLNQRKDIQVNRFISTVAAVYLHLATAAWCVGMADGFIAYVPYVITMVYLLVSELYLKQPNPIANWACTMLAQMYIAMPFAMVNILAFRINNTGEPAYNWMLPLSIFIFLWTNDTGAYCTGSLFGKHKLFPRVSPGKSWEGSIGGAILVVAAAAAIAWFDNVEVADKDMPPALLSMTVWIGLGLVVVVFGTWGDLVESLFKRTLGIKDSGNILPGHGGMLDRFDSSLLAIPMAVVYLYTISLL
jgi:phosphatidate cytidylyltransferase